MSSFLGRVECQAPSSLTCAPRVVLAEQAILTWLRSPGRALVGGGGSTAVLGSCLSSLLLNKLHFFTQTISDENMTQGQGQSLGTRRVGML